MEINYCGNSRSGYWNPEPLSLLLPCSLSSYPSSLLLFPQLLSILSPSVPSPVSCLPLSPILFLSVLHSNPLPFLPSFLCHFLPPQLLNQYYSFSFTTQPPQTPTSGNLFGSFLHCPLIPASYHTFTSCKFSLI